MNKEQNVIWLKQLNEFGVLKGAKKFRKQGFSNIQFDKWLHKATFWYHVKLQTSLHGFPFSICCPLLPILTTFSFCSLKLKRSSYTLPQSLTSSSR
jgi:hypothetical protein